MITRLMPRTTYEALDSQGQPYLREARIVGEIHHSSVRSALDAALPVLSKSLGMQPKQPLKYGLPVYKAFGLNRSQAARHQQARLLQTQGCDLSLDYVPTFSAKEIAA